MIQRHMKHPRLFATVVCLAATLTFAQEPPKEQGEIALALWPLPSVTKLGQFEILIMEPNDPEMKSRGGSGGQLYDLVVTNPRGGISPASTIQAIWLYARLEGDQSLAFSIWSKTGLGSYVQCRHAMTTVGYCTEWCQDYEVSDDYVKASGARRTQPECEQAGPGARIFDGERLVADDETPPACPVTRVIE